MKKLVIIIFLFLNGILPAQTTNIGELSITPGTIMSTVGELDNKTTGYFLNNGDLFVYNHFNNDGLVTFSPGLNSGLTRIRGLFGFQNISQL